MWWPPILAIHEKNNRKKFVGGAGQLAKIGIHKNKALYSMDHSIVTCVAYWLVCSLATEKHLSVHYKQAPFCAVCTHAYLEPSPPYSCLYAPAYLFLLNYLCSLYWIPLSLCRSHGNNTAFIRFDNYSQWLRWRIFKQWWVYVYRCQSSPLNHSCG